MKKTILLLALLLSGTAGFSQNYYVIIGVFAKEDNAVKYTGYARSKYLNAEYLLNKKRNLHYVFVLKTANKAAANDRTKQIRTETEFNEAWVFVGFLGDDTQLEDAPPVVEEPAVVVIETEPVPEPEVAQDTISTAPVEEPITTVVDSVAAVKPLPKPKGKYFKFVITNSEGASIPGQVHYVDLDQGRDIATYKANEYADISRSSNQEKPMTVVCGIFGYQEVIKVIDYTDPGTTEGAVKDENGAWVIPYSLVRLKKGDASVMYHVSFFKDAVIMTKESKTEMDELVNMMNMNPGYEIKIHGHCNGNNNRRIIALGDPKNYFDIKGSDERPGSAKDLTELRAQAVKDYLIENGINKDRMKTFAWAGNGMLVGENSNSARLNDRIEIEITAD